MSDQPQYSADLCPHGCGKMFDSLTAFMEHPCVTGEPRAEDTEAMRMEFASRDFLVRQVHADAAKIKALEAERDEVSRMVIESIEKLTVTQSARDLLAEKLGRLVREVSVTLDQWAHEREQGRSGVVYGSRIGLLREALREAIAATEDKP